MSCGQNIADCINIGPCHCAFVISPDHSLLPAADTPSPTLIAQPTARFRKWRGGEGAAGQFPVGGGGGGRGQAQTQTGLFNPSFSDWCKWSLIITQLHEVKVSNPRYELAWLSKLEPAKGHLKFFFIFQDQRFNIKWRRYNVFNNNRPQKFWIRNYKITKLQKLQLGDTLTHLLPPLVWEQPLPPGADKLEKPSLSQIICILPGEAFWVWIQLQDEQHWPHSASGASDTWPLLKAGTFFLLKHFPQYCHHYHNHNSLEHHHHCHNHHH